MLNKKIKNVICITTLLALVGCASIHEIDNDTSTQGEDALPYRFSNFTDIPVPDQSEMNMSQTALYGHDSTWLGKLVFSTPYNVGGVYDFYVEEMQKFGWTEITSVRGMNSVLTFMRDNRVALIQLQPSSFRGTDVLFTVSPAPHKLKKNTKTTIKQYKKKQVDNVNNNNSNNMEQMNSGTIETKRINAMPLSQSNLFVSPEARKSLPGSLGLGEASNQYYKSNSKGVGKPVEI